MYEAPDWEQADMNIESETKIPATIETQRGPNPEALEVPGFITSAG
jgi:hypothetical protein